MFIIVQSGLWGRPAQGWAPPAPAQEHRAPTIGPAGNGAGLHLPQPLYPTGRELHHFLGTLRRKRCHENASSAPNNQLELRLPLMQAFVQLVPPASPPLLPVVIIVMVDVLAVVRCLVPGVDYTRPQDGGYEVVQRTRGYELLVDQELSRLCSVIFENLAAKLVL